MEYHVSDAFSTSDGNGRYNYYSIEGVPTAKFDGWRTVIGGSSSTFGVYLWSYNQEMNSNPSACSLDISVDYDSTTRKLWVKARVTAVDPFENARLRYAIAESHIYYPWQWLDSLHHVVRKMLPNYVGVALPAMNPNDTFVDSQTYILSPAWEDDNCYVVVFVQKDDFRSRMVLRSAKSPLFLRYTFGDANGDGEVDIADVVYLGNYLFVNGPPPDPPASGDPNHDCTVDVADAVYLVNWLFTGGPDPQEGCAQ